MIYRQRRDRIAELLRHFVVGRMTNVEFEERLDRVLDLPGPAWRWEDGVLWAIRGMAWYLYDDLQTHYLRGARALDKESRREVARWIMFLRSNREYEWPAVSLVNPGGCILSTLTLGSRMLGWTRRRAIEHFPLTLGWTRRRALERFRASGDFDVWPFLRHSDFAEELRNPSFLTGKERQVHL